MIIKNLLPFLVICYTTISLAQQKDTIYGNVKSIREQLFFLDEGRQNLKLFEKEGDYGHYGFSSPKFTQSRFHNWWYSTYWTHYSNYYKEFNKKGKPTYEIWFYQNGDTVTRLRYKYDKKENLIQRKEIDNQNEYTARNYTYDNNNKMISTIYYISDDPSTYSYSEYIYDENDRIIEVRNFHDDGETYSDRHTYYPNGKVKDIIGYSPYLIADKSKSNKKGCESLGSTYKYDLNGNVIEKIRYNDNYCMEAEEIQMIYRFEYKNQLLIKTTRIGRNKKVIGYTLYSYNKQQLKIKEESFSYTNVKPNISYKYYYDQNGNQKQLIYTDKNESVTVDFKYEFDDHKNWTKQTKYVNGEKLYVWKRELTYFDLIDR